MTTPSPGAASERPWTWHFLRASSWVLLAVFPIWFASVHLVGDASTVTATSLARRWSSPSLRVLDWLVVVLGLAHGAAGLAAVLQSRRADRSRGGLGVAVVYGSTAVLGLAVTAVVFTYEVT